MYTWTFQKVSNASKSQFTIPLGLIGNPTGKVLVYAGTHQERELDYLLVIHGLDTASQDFSIPTPKTGFHPDCNKKSDIVSDLLKRNNARQPGSRMLGGIEKWQAEFS